jgi:hypothetical protein
MATKLYVGNLAFQTTEDELKEFFHRVQPEESVAKVEGRRRGRSRGSRFIELATVGESGSEPAGATTRINLTVREDEEANVQISRYFAKIAESRERARRTQLQIARLKKKTQAIIDKM